jgi:hypothetical protein
MVSLPGFSRIRSDRSFLFPSPTCHLPTAFGLLLSVLWRFQRTRALSRRHQRAFHRRAHGSKFNEIVQVYFSSFSTARSSLFNPEGMKSLSPGLRQKALPRKRPLQKSSPKEGRFPNHRIVLAAAVSQPSCRLVSATVRRFGNRRSLGFREGFRWGWKMIVGVDPG